MIAMMTAMFVLSCFSPLISEYVRDQLHAVGTQTVNAVAKDFSKKYVALWGLVGLAIATFVLALFQTAWLAGVNMFGIGFAIAFTLVPAQTLIHQGTPGEMLGRVSSSFFALFSLSQLLPARYCWWCCRRPAICGCVKTSPKKKLSRRQDKCACCVIRRRRFPATSCKSVLC
jgi:MFS family permease